MPQPDRAPDRPPDGEHVIYIRAAPERIWEALTSPELTPLYFFGRRLVSDWTPGAPWTAHLPQDSPQQGVDTEGEVLESDPPRRLVVTWRVQWIEEMRALPQAVVAYDIAPMGEATRLTVSEYVDPSVPKKFREGGMKGWPMILSSLKSLLETGRPLIIEMKPPA